MSSTSAGSDAMLTLDTALLAAVTGDPEASLLER
jgi:hypothetical protein